MTIKFKKWQQTTPNGHKIYQHYPFKGPPKYTQIGIFCMTINHLATVAVGKKHGSDTKKILKMGDLVSFS
jgi:hypothetical protein